jgi:hypothetical protein
MAKFAHVMHTRHQHSKRTHVFLDKCRVHDDPRLAAVEMLTRNIVLWFLPRNTTHFSQPLDVWVIAALKNIHRSRLRKYGEAANISDNETNRSMTLIFIIEALTSLQAARSTRPSFIHVGISGGKVDVVELFNRRARGDTATGTATVQTNAKPAYSPVSLARQSLLINETANTIHATRAEAANRTQATHNRLVVMPPIRKGVLVSSTQIAEAAVEHVMVELPTRIDCRRPKAPRRS